MGCVFLGMTVKDKEKFEKLWKKLEKRMETLTRKDLEKLCYFLVLALACEGWYTMELRETAKRLGIADLIEEGLK